jgi:hypothetical protein
MSNVRSERDGGPPHFYVCSNQQRNDWESSRNLKDHTDRRGSRAVIALAHAVWYRLFSSSAQDSKQRGGTTQEREGGRGADGRKFCTVQLGGLRGPALLQTFLRKDMNSRLDSCKGRPLHPWALH